MIGFGTLGTRLYQNFIISTPGEGLSPNAWARDTINTQDAHTYVGLSEN